MYEYLIDDLLALVESASERILDIYQQPIAVAVKADQSPLTQADVAAHEVLVKGLNRLLPEVPIMSEEGALVAFNQRRHWQRYWLIDPLDGTKEFIDKNGEFTVNIALIEHGQPILGVVGVPVTGVMYWGMRGIGAFKVRPSCSDKQSLSTRLLSQASDNGLNVLVSRRHGMGVSSESIVQRELEQHFTSVQYNGYGSSLKFCLIAEGVADFYPRLAPTSEWDTAAAQAIVEAAGGQVCDFACKPLRYNTKISLLNPSFYVVGDPSYPWDGLLSQIIAE